MLQIVRSGFHRLHKNSSVRLIVNSGFSSDAGQKDGDNGDQHKTSKAGKSGDQKQDVKSKAALNRLNELLSMMTTESEVQLVKKVQVAKPVGQNRDKRKERKRDSRKQDSDSDSDSDDEKPKDLAKATKKVAEALGGDTKKTEAELLNKLLGGEAGGAEGGASLTDIITGMQVDKEGTKKSKGVQLTRSNVVRKAIEKKGQKGQDYVPHSRERRKPVEAIHPSGASVKLFDGESLNIFTDPAVLKDSPDVLQTWRKLQDRELRLAVTHPPANYFEKMALWTEQGKLWKFPIDNEQGLDEEAKVSFTEHIFLEEHLEPWCPKRGPIRHFMELVCVGLSKNYFITAQEKKEHILWFRDYFEQKKDLLKQVIVQQQETSSEKKLA